MIDLVNSINKIENFIDSSEIVGIIVGQPDPINDPNQIHCGIVYRYQNKFNAIHLAWHNTLSHDENYLELSNYFFVKSTIHKFRQNSIAAMCRLILNRHYEKKIPYGLFYSGGHFNKDGVICLDSKESGLTCATFVLAVFLSCDIQLIDIENWQPRSSDTEWHLSIIDLLIKTKDKYNISDLHIENVTNEIGCSRFRPEEVAISSAFKDIPAESEKIIENAKKLRDVLMQVY